MRVRLYVCGNPRTGTVVRIDQFPVKLTLDETGRLRSIQTEESPFCLIEDLGGELYLHAIHPDQSVFINDAEVESGPLLPGDHLKIGNQCYVVSYEQSACEFRSAMKVRILN